MIALLGAIVATGMTAKQSASTCTDHTVAEFRYRYEVADGETPVFTAYTRKDDSPLDGCLHLNQCGWKFAPTAEFLENLNRAAVRASCKSKEETPKNGKPEYAGVFRCDRSSGGDISAPYRAIGGITQSLNIDCSTFKEAISPAHWLLFQASLGGGGCMTVGISPTATTAGVELSALTCGSPNAKLLESLPKGGFLVVGELPAPITWEIVSSASGWIITSITHLGVGEEYNESWSKAVAVAANSGQLLVRPLSDPLSLDTGASRDVQLDWLVHWGVSAMYALQAKILTNSDRFWSGGATWRDWMAEAVLRNPRAAAETFYRAECARSQNTGGSVCP